MTLKIDLSEEASRSLEEAAAREGLALSEYARRLLEACVADVGRSTRASANRATLELYEDWRRADETADPAELDRRDRSFEQLMRDLDEERERDGASRKLFS